MVLQICVIITFLNENLAVSLGFVGLSADVGFGRLAFGLGFNDVVSLLALLPTGAFLCGSRVKEKE
jgi:hypothetical protein